MPPPVAPRLVATVGRVSDSGSFSGIPFHLLQAGQRAGLLDAGLDLPVDGSGMRLKRIVWNGTRFVSGRDRGGFQYSEAFLTAMWKGHRDQLAGSGSTILNCFQLYPSSMVNDRSVDKWFFLDQTLTQLFAYYEQSKVVGPAIVADAIAREAAGYRAAEGLIVHSRWAKTSVVNDYGIAPEKVRVVVVGPSLDFDRIQSHALRPGVPAPGEALKLIFVGKEWRRKGLDRLLRALVITRRKGSNIGLRVIGCPRASVPEPLREVEDVEWLGFIDKRKEEDRFIGLLCESHIGCSLSLYEAGGVALREYHSLGLPVIGPDTGGAPEHMIPAASIAVSPSADDEEVADLLHGLCRDRDRLAAMNEAAWQARASASWAASMESLASFWPTGHN